MSSEADGPTGENAWQPIDTAPRDGTVILIKVEVEPGRTVITTASWRMLFGVGAWRLMLCGAHAEDDEVYPDPSGWMTLPDVE